MSRKVQDLTGMKFGKWIVIERGEYYKSPKGQRCGTWVCKCECGKSHERAVRTSDLINGKSKSCGCLHNELLSKSKYKHGLSHTRLHRIWAQMKDRCENKNNNEYHHYGGEGKTVCDEWKGEHGAENFIKWSMANGYTDNLTIDRIDYTKGYSPDNCRWTTMKEQNNNKRTNHILKFNGKSQTIMQWAEEYNINYGTLWSRISNGWEVEKALTTPARKLGTKKWGR